MGSIILTTWIIGLLLCAIDCFIMHLTNKHGLSEITKGQVLCVIIGSFVPGIGIIISIVAFCTIIIVIAIKAANSSKLDELW